MGAETIRIGGIVDISTVDWYGHVTFMIFTSGCPFRCHFCQNASLVPLDSGREVSLDELKSKIRESQMLIDAIGFSGGEPTIQPKPLIELSCWAKGRGLGVFLNTNGVNPDLVGDLINRKLVDYIALSVVAPLEPEEYARVAGIPPREARSVVSKVKRTLQLCLASGVPLEVRTTIVPTLIDDEESVRKIARSVRGCNVYVLQQFSPLGDILDPAFKKIRAPTREELIRLGRIALAEGLEAVRIRTREAGEEPVTIA